MLREIAARVGVQVDAKDLGGLMSMLDQAKTALLGFGSALAGAAIVGFVAHQIELADTIGDTADRLGVTADELQRFQYALELTGAKGEDAQRAIFLFNKSLGAAASGGGADAFTKLGIAIKGADGRVRPMLDVLPEVADKVAEAGSSAEQTAIATELFGKSALHLLPLLKRGREGVKELNAEFDDLGGGIGQSAIENAGKIDDSLHRLKFVTQALTVNALLPLLEMLIPLFAWLTKGAAAISSLVKNTNIGQTALYALYALSAFKLIPMVYGMVRAFTAMRVAVMGASLPLWLIVAALAFLYLLFDDIYTLMTGGNSLIGNFLDSMYGVGTSAKLVEKLRGAWKTLKFDLGLIQETFENLWPVILDGLNEVYDAIAFVVTEFASLLGIVLDIKRESKPTKKVLTGANNAEAEKLLHPDGTGVGGHSTSDYLGLFKAGIDATTGNGAFGAGNTYKPTSLDNVQALAGMMGVKVQAMPVTNNITVTVPPGTDPSAVPKAVTDGVAKGVQASTADAFHAVSTHVPGTP